MRTPDLDAPLPVGSRTFVRTAEEAARVAARMTREYEAEHPEEAEQPEPGDEAALRERAETLEKESRSKAHEILGPRCATRLSDGDHHDLCDGVTMAIFIARRAHATEVAELRAEVERLRGELAGRNEVCRVHGEVCVHGRAVGGPCLHCGGRASK